jgi:hypothetical protein
MIPELPVNSDLSEIVRGVIRNTAELKIRNSLIRKHCSRFEIADAVLVLNYKKNGAKNSLDGNSFLEMGFAHVLGKRIFLLNDIRQNETYYDEVVAMKPIIVYGDLAKLEWLGKALEYSREVVPAVACDQRV